MTKEVLTGDGSDITIDDLVVHVKYLARNVTSGVRELSVSSGPNLNPVIVIDHPDINGRLDGAGSFSRMFAQSTQLRIQAPNSYGRYQFDGWQVADRDLTNRSPTLSLFLESNSKVVAKYVLSAEPLRLRIIGTLPGQIRLEFPTVSGSTYTLEAAPELAHPAWTPVDTIVGDGLPAILTRSSRPSAAGSSGCARRHSRLGLWFACPHAVSHTPPSHTNAGSGDPNYRLSVVRGPSRGFPPGPRAHQS